MPRWMNRGGKKILGSRWARWAIAQVWTRIWGLENHIMDQPGKKAWGKKVFLAVVVSFSRYEERATCGSDKRTMDELSLSWWEVA